MSQAEADIYIVMLSRPSMTIQEIAKYSNLPRSTVVVALEKLARLGVIDEYTHGKRRNFVISSPRAIERYVEDQERSVSARKAQLGNLITDIQELHFLQISRGSKIEILKGEQGFKDLYNKTLDLKRGEEILRLSIEAEKFVFYPDFLRKYCQEKNKKGIKTRLLIPESKLGIDVRKKDADDLRVTRFLNKKLYNPKMAIAIFGNYVSLTNWDETLETTLIESAETVDIFRSVFELLWLNSK